MSGRAPTYSSGAQGSSWQVPSRSWGTGEEFLRRGPQALADRAGGPRRPHRHLRTLGLLNESDDPHFLYWEFEFLRWVRGALTRDWPVVQGGKGLEGTRKWFEVLMVLELDEIAQMDLMCLAHHGCSGRALANQILWEVLTDQALTRPYEDLSNLVTTKVNVARKILDRPPRDHEHRGRWDWGAYSSQERSPFSPSAVPRPFPTRITAEAGGLPQAPPWCWRPIEEQR